MAPLKEPAPAEGTPKSMESVPDPVEIPTWFMELPDKERTDLLSFVWGIERAEIEWTKEILFQMMTCCHNLNPHQAEEAIKLLCAGMPNDKHSVCVMCGFPALDDDAKLISCAGCASKHCHVLCGAADGWKCEACDDA